MRVWAKTVTEGKMEDIKEVEPRLVLDVYGKWRATQQDRRYCISYEQAYI